MSSGLDAFNLSALRATFGKALTRVITITLRHRSMCACCRLFLLYDVVTTIYLVNTHRLRCSINGRVLTNTITLRCNNRRILECILVINGRLLNILERTMTAMAR